MNPSPTPPQIDPADDLQALAVVLHRHLLGLGLFDAYGDMCLVMALAQTKLLAHHRIAAQGHFCNLAIAREQRAVRLGFEDPTAKIPTELIDTHAVCAADERLLLEVGLGQVRKAWHAPVYDSAMATFTPHSQVMATHSSITASVSGCSSRVTTRLCVPPSKATRPWRRQSLGAGAGARRRMRHAPRAATASSRRS